MSFTVLRFSVEGESALQSSAPAFGTDALAALGALFGVTASTFGAAAFAFGAATFEAPRGVATFGATALGATSAALFFTVDLAFLDAFLAAFLVAPFTTGVSPGATCSPTEEEKNIGGAASTGALALTGALARAFLTGALTDALTGDLTGAGAGTGTGAGTEALGAGAGAEAFARFGAAFAFAARFGAAFGVAAFTGALFITGAADVSPRKRLISAFNASTSRDSVVYQYKGE